MANNDVHRHIEELVAEEHRLWEAEGRGDGTDADRRRLEQVKVELDQFWDLLRRRRTDPDAELRSAATVENYLQ
jgi:hypothetical protein